MRTASSTALRSAIHKAPNRLVFFAFDLLHLDGQELRRSLLIARRTALRKLIGPDPRLEDKVKDVVEELSSEVWAEVLGAMVWLRRQQLKCRIGSCLPQ
jgi:ATP-dependent DNA ligase